MRSGRDEGDVVEVQRWDPPGWNGRRGLVTKVLKDGARIVAFRDWSPTDVLFRVEDIDHLEPIA